MQEFNVWIVTPAWDTWQTTRFSVFARQSRVEVNAQRDLEEMLAKLDSSKADPENEDEGQGNRKQRRKYVELAVPGAALTLICIIYCLVYLTNLGHDIAHAQQMKHYLGQLWSLDSAVQALFEEVQARADCRLGKIGYSELDINYTTSYNWIHKVLPSKSVVEWRLISRIEDHRKLYMRDMCTTEEVMQDVLFYSQFLSDLMHMVFKDVLHFDVMYKWKTYYEFEKHFKNNCRINLYIIAIMAFQEFTKHRSNMTSCTDVFETSGLFASKIGALLEELPDEGGNKTKSSGLTPSSSLLDNIELLTNDKINQSMLQNSSTPTLFSDYFRHLRNQENFARKHQILFLKRMNTMNSKALNTGIVCFVFVFISLCITSVCALGFGKILKHESRLVVGVSDWLHSVTTELDDQRDSTDVIVNKIVPRVVKESVDLGCVANMFPYHSSEATLFMCSIAHFNKFFNMFNASQTLHILTLVMELLEERMDEYTVFPVSRMGNYQVVMSDTVQRRKSQHACEIANLALDIMTCCSDLEIGKQHVSKLQMKIGIHSGPNSGMLCIRNGVMRFDITGMSCAILQRVHKTALPNRIQVSDTTYKLLSACETYSLHLRGNIKARGLPQLKIFWLDGRKVSSGAADRESESSRIGSWIEFERKPLYRLDEEEGLYEPLDKMRARRYSQMSMGSGHFPNASIADQYDVQSSSS